MLQAPGDRTVEHILPDGTSLTLAPGSALTITGYAFDADARTGSLALRLAPGLFRIAGGAINNAAPIVMTTGEGEQACRIELSNGTAVVAVDRAGGARAYLLLGERLTMTSGEATAVLVRTGFQLTSRCEGDEPQEAALDEDQLRADLFGLNPGLLVAVTPGAGPDDDDTTDVPDDDTDDDTPPGDDDDDVVVTPPDDDDDDDVVVTPPDDDDDVVVTPPDDDDDVVVTPPDDVVVTPPDDVVVAPPPVEPPVVTPPPVEPPVVILPPVEPPVVTPPPPVEPPAPTLPGRVAGFDSGLGGGVGFGAGSLILGVNQREDQPSQTADRLRSASQNRLQDQFRQVGIDSSDNPLFDNLHRNPGLTTNRIFSSPFAFEGLLQANSQFGIPTPALDIDIDSPQDLNDPNISAELQYIFNSFGFATAGSIFSLDAVGDEGRWSWIGSGESPGSIQSALSLNLRTDPTNLPQFPEHGRTESYVIADDLDFDNRSFLGPVDVELLQAGFLILNFDQLPDGPFRDRLATVAEERARGTGVPLDEFALEVAFREDDNFVLLHLRQRRVDEIFRDQLRADFEIGTGSATDVMTPAGLTAFRAALNQDIGVEIFLEPAPVSQQIALFVMSDFKVGQQLTREDIPFELSDEDAFLLLRRLNIVTRSSSDNDGTGRFIFAAGDVGPNRDNTFTVDGFFISPGLDGFEQKDGTDRFGTIKHVPDGVRAFLRKETALGIHNFKDSGVFVVNPDFRLRDHSDFEDRAAFLHGDFGRDGEGPNERSTISITIGDVQYNAPGERFEFPDPTDPDAPNIVIEAGNDEVRVSAHTFGSSRDNTQGTGDAAPASTFFTSRLFNTAAGGGNPALQVGQGDPPNSPIPDNAGDPREGRLGYFVIENFEPERFTDTDANRIPGGTVTGGLETPLNPLGTTPEEQQYAILRLATAQGSVPFATDPEDTHTPETIGPRTGRNLIGFAAGLGEFQQDGAIGVTPVDAGVPMPVFKPLDPNLWLTTDPLTNRVSGHVTLTGIDPGNPRIELGRGSDESAFVDDDTFGVRTTAAGERLQAAAGGGTPVAGTEGQYAFITAGILTDKSPTGTTRTLANFDQPIPDLQHVQWGFFLGERLAAPGGNDPHVREHVHMGTWATGRQLDPSELSDWAGQATFQGIAAGNVFNDGALSTAIGRFSNTWHFGRREGQVVMDFDDARYRGTTQLEANRPQFVGALEAVGKPRVGRLDGGFVGEVNEFRGNHGGRGRGPTGLVGQFAIQETQGPTYRAVGTVAADRKNK